MVKPCKAKASQEETPKLFFLGVNTPYHPYHPLSIRLVTSGPAWPPRGSDHRISPNSVAITHMGPQDTTRSGILRRTFGQNAVVHHAKGLHGLRKCNLTAQTWGFHGTSGRFLRSLKNQMGVLSDQKAASKGTNKINKPRVGEVWRTTS